MWFGWDCPNTQLQDLIVRANVQISLHHALSPDHKHWLRVSIEPIQACEMQEDICLDFWQASFPLWGSYQRRPSFLLRLRGSLVFIVLLMERKFIEHQRALYTRPNVCKLCSNLTVSKDRMEREREELGPCLNWWVLILTCLIWHGFFCFVNQYILLFG